MEGQIEAMFRTEAEAPAPEQLTETIAETPATPAEAPVEPIAEPDAPEQPSPEPVVEAEAPKTESERAIPLATGLEWRDRMKAAERRVAEFEAQQRQQQTAVPSPFDDPDGYQAHVQGLAQQAIIADRFERSNEDAVDKWGEEKVTAALAWAQDRARDNPTFASEYMSKTRPIQWIVQQHQREDDLTKLGGKTLDEYIQEEIARRQIDPSAPVVAAQAAPMNPAPKPQAPPKSIAGDASPTSSAPADPSAFWSFLDRK